MRRWPPGCRRGLLIAATIRGSLLPGTASGTLRTEFPTHSKERGACRTPKFSHPKPQQVQPQMGGSERTPKCSPEMELPQVAIDGGRTRLLHFDVYASGSVRAEQPTCA